MVVIIYATKVHAHTRYIANLIYINSIINLDHVNIGDFIVLKTIII